MTQVACHGNYVPMPNEFSVDNFATLEPDNSGSSIVIKGLADLATLRLDLFGMRRSGARKFVFLA